MTLAAETRAHRRKHSRRVSPKGERRILVRLQAQHAELKRQVAELQRQVDALANVPPMPEPVQFSEDIWAAFDAETRKYRELADA